MDCPTDNYYWKKKESKKTIKKRWCRTSNSIKYCPIHHCRGPHGIVPKFISSEDTKIISSDESNDVEEVIIFSSRKSIKRYSKILEQFPDCGYICHHSNGGIRKSFKGYVDYVKKFLDKEHRKNHKKSKSFADIVHEDRKKFLKRKKFFNDKKRYQGNEICGICMSQMKNKIVEVTACKHTFCKSCYDYLKRYNLEENNYNYCTLKCPLCRSNIYNGKPLIYNSTAEM